MKTQKAKKGLIKKENVFMFDQVHDPKTRIRRLLLRPRLQTSFRAGKSSLNFEAPKGASFFEVMRNLCSALGQVSPKSENPKV